MSAMLQLHNATYRKGNTDLVKDVSLSVAPGEFVAIVGANGAGKTTTMRLLAGELNPSAGLASMGSEDLSTADPAAVARTRAVLPQNSSLTFDFSVLEVVLMGRIPHESGRDIDLEIASQAMEVSRVAHLSSRRYTTLSGGEQQRVHLARVLSQIWEAQGDIPRFLLLDEPTSSLDLSHQHDVLGAARQAAEAGVGVVAVLHDLNLAAQYSDRIVVLKKGEVLAEGPCRSVLTQSVIREAFDMQVMILEHPCDSCPLVVPAISLESQIISIDDIERVDGLPLDSSTTIPA